MRRVIGSTALLAMLLVAGPAPASPRPVKPVSAQFFTGRWYEIARSPNVKQKDCQAPTYDFQPRDSGGPNFVLTCYKGSPDGPADRLNARIKLPGAGANNRFRVSVFGGLVSADYLILDRADDLSWAILATTGGQDVWLLARKTLVRGWDKAVAVERIGALGYDVRSLVYPRHKGG